MSNRPGPAHQTPALGLIAFATASATVIALGRRLPSTPRSLDAIADWIRTVGAPLAALTVLRYVMILVIAWFAVTTAAALVARALGGVRAIRWTDAVLTPAQRRLLRVGLTVGVTLSHPLTASATTAQRPEPIIMTVIDDTAQDQRHEPDEPPTTTSTATTTTTTASPDAIIMTVIDDAAQDERHEPIPAPTTSTGPPTRTPTTIGVPEPAVRPPSATNPPVSPAGEPGPAPTETMTSIPDGARTWIIQPGEHLWAVAQQTLRAHGLDAGDPATLSYLRTLIDANRDVLVVADQPDLVYPGQVFVLPALPTT